MILNRTLTRATLLAVVVLEVLAFHSASAEEPPAIPAAEVLKHMRQSLARVQSVQYDFQQVNTGPSREGRTRTVITDGSFAWSEGKFYCQNQLDLQPPSFVHLAFDGELYQRMEEGRKRLVVTTEVPKIPYVVLQPILLPYLFLPRGDEPFSIETYQREDLWQTVITKATLADPLELDGRPCQVVKFSTTGKVGGELHWEICAAGDLEWFPIHKSNHGGEGERRTDSTCSVKKFTELKTPRGRIIFPLEVEIVSLNAKGEKTHTSNTTVYETSIKINEPIDKEKFWLKRLKPVQIRFFGNTADEQEERFEKGPR